MMSRVSFFLTSTCMLASWFATSLQASFIFSVSQVGTSVVTTGSGTINTSSLSLSGNGQASGSYAIPDEAVLIGGPLVTTSDQVFKGISGPSAIGSGGPNGFPIGASSGGGDLFGIAGNNTLLLPTNYVSGAPLSNTDTYLNYTLASLGYTPGTYLYTWGSGPTADSLTINIGTVPEPATAAVLAIPASLALLRRRPVVRRQ